MLWLLHKPVGGGSGALVRAFGEERTRLLGKAPKLVHGGALDPFATGLLAILEGPATRLMEALHPIPKRYIAGLVFGAETDTGDAGGTIVARGDPAGLTPARLEAALRAFVGWHDQVPPATSNKRIDGERAWVLAHRGERGTLPACRGYLHDVSLAPPASESEATVTLTVRGGFYVRALVRDLGRALGVPAHLRTLHRSAIGPWEDPGPEGTPPPVSGAAILPWLPSRELHDHELGALRAGEAISVGPLQAPIWPLPQGFPGPDGDALAMHQGRLVAWLVRGPQGFTARALLSR